MNIRKVLNGYIVNIHGEEKIYFTLDELFSDLLLHFEGRGKYFKGDKFGRIKIIRIQTGKLEEND